MVLMGRNVIRAAYVDYYPKNNKSFHCDNIKIFDFNCPDPKKNAVVTGKNQKIVYMDINK